MGEAAEREHIRKAVEITTQVCGVRPVGMYQGKPNINTRKLVVEEGGFLYDSDCYSDDLPFWNLEHGRPHLVIPYTLDVNDMRFATPQGFNCGDQFYTYLKVRVLLFALLEGWCFLVHISQNNQPLSLFAGFLRLPAPGRPERQPQDDVGGAALSAGGQARAGGRPGALLGLRQEL